MARPIKDRCTSCVPAASYFKPVGIPMRELDEIVLGIDELEAMRLTDLDGLYQAKAAEKMGVSRQTIGNILNSAHRKLADALLNGKALRIGPLVEERDPGASRESADCRPRRGATEPQS